MAKVRGIVIDNRLERGKRIKKIVEEGDKRIKIITACKHGTEADIAVRMHKPQIIFVDLSYDFQLEQIRTGYYDVPAVFYSSDKSIVSSLNDHGFQAFSIPPRFSSIKRQIRHCLASNKAETVTV